MAGQFLRSNQNITSLYYEIQNFTLAHFEQKAEEASDSHKEHITDTKKGEPNYAKYIFDKGYKHECNDNHIYPRKLSIEGCLWNWPHVFILTYRNTMYKILWQSASCSIYLKIMKMLVTACTTMRGEHNTRTNMTHYM